MKKGRYIRQLLPVLVITVIAAVLIFINAYALGKREARGTVQELYGIVGIIKERYPELSDEEIVHSIKEGSRETEDLSSDEVSRLGRAVLEKYGYEDGYLSLTQKRNLRFSGLVGALIVFSAGFMICLYMMVVNAKRRKDIEELTDYLSLLTNRKYDMELKDNSEDDLSLLRNEIYKTKVSLRETSELSKKESAALSRSLEDISHQLKTPLTSIRVMLDNIIEDEDMPAEIRQDFLDSISRQMEWIQSLVISLLKLARIDAGQVKLKQEDVDMESLVKDSVDKLAVIMDLKNVSVKINPVEKVNDKGIPIPEPVMKGDYNWQLEAVTNIIKNSIEHSSAGETVYVSIEPTSVYNRIIVRDEGEGISEKDIKHIFERFYKSENSGPDSVGIGLALSKSIIEAGGGYITVESKKGEGTSFVITYVK